MKLGGAFVISWPCRCFGLIFSLLHGCGRTSTLCVAVWEKKKKAHRTVQAREQATRSQLRTEEAGTPKPTPCFFVLPCCCSALVAPTPNQYWPSHAGQQSTATGLLQLCLISEHIMTPCPAVQSRQTRSGALAWWMVPGIREPLQ